MFQRLLDETLELIPAADGAAIEIAGADDSLIQVAGIGRLKRPFDIRIKVSGTNPGKAMETGTIQVCHEASSDQNPNARLCQELGINSMIYVPLVRRQKSAGVLHVSSALHHAFSSDDVERLASVAGFVSSVTGAVLDFIDVNREAQIAATRAALEHDISLLSGANDESSSALARSVFITKVLRPESQRQAERRKRVEQLMNNGGLTMVLQPIMSLDDDRRIIEVEALARFDGTPTRGPDYWFHEAASVGLGVSFELFAIRRALELLPQIPLPVALAINAGPETFVSPELCDILTSVDSSRVIVELTEHTDIVDSPTLQRACQNLRTLGCKIAIDDTGTGFASLAVVLHVQPDIIKLDRELTRGIDAHPVRRALASALMTFGNEIGADVIAEGIETVEQLNTLVDVGICYGQGFYLARPGSLVDLFHQLTSAKRSGRTHQRFERKGSPVTLVRNDDKTFP
jgi:EAL domain-containing protein (putative c-di-GMP-specific phosphodiesterase class I)